MDEHREYDVIDFNVAFTPSRYSEPVTFRMENEDRYFFERIIDDHIFPYSKIDHIIRHAVIRQREYLLRLLPIKMKGRSKYATWSHIRMERRRLLEETHFGLVLDVVSPMILTFSMKHDLNAAVLIIERLLHRVFNMKSPYFRETYLKEITQKWGHILKATNRLDLLPRRISLVDTPSSPQS